MTTCRDRDNEALEEAFDDLFDAATEDGICAPCLGLMLLEDALLLLLTAGLSPQEIMLRIPDAMHGAIISHIDQDDDEAPEVMH